MADTAIARFEPDWLSPPGETIADLLDEHGWTQAELASRTGFTKKHVNELVSGKSAISPDAALRLEATIGGNADFWLAREAQYREALARRSAEEALAAHSAWLKELPLADMVRFGWVRKLRSVGAQVAECLKFFGVASVSAWIEQYERPVAVAFRASDRVRKSVGAVAAWLRRGEQAAQAIDCQPFDHVRFKSKLWELRALTLEPNPQVFLPKLVSSCAEVGVAVVFVRTPRGCPACGATRWLTPEKALLQLSLRYKTNDHLWFTIFHEAGHILLHGKKMLFIESPDLGGIEEEEANRFARDVLIPASHASRLSTMATTHAAVSAFAREISIAPGIVVGRMQYERLMPWSYLNDMKVRYSLADESS